MPQKIAVDGGYAAAALSSPAWLGAIQGWGQVIIVILGVAVGLVRLKVALEERRVQRAAREAGE